MAEQNCDWGYRRILGPLSNLGYQIARGTIANILKNHGIEPAPEREKKTTWKEFLRRHWSLIVAADFFTVEVWTHRGLQRYFVLFFIELSTRNVEIGGIARDPNGLWMSQIGRNLTMRWTVFSTASATSSMIATRCSPRSFFPCLRIPV